MALADDLEAAIRAAGAGAPFDFDAWALRVFAYQYARNVPYRRFCERRGVSPDAVTDWRAVPAVPTVAFRHADLSCDAPELIFRTSGTTGGPEARGRHLLPHPSLYRAAALPTFERHLLPDGVRPHFLCLLPAPDLRPDSSLVHMCAWVAEAFGADVVWYGTATGLDVERLADDLGTHATRGTTLLLAGPTAGFARLFDTGIRVRLGPGSRLMDTGGAKGMRRPLSRPGLLRTCWDRLGIPTHHCVNEYGMTELCSQRYESVLADRFAGRSLDRRRLVGPPWLRTRVLDPDTLATVPDGVVGLLCHHDLANAGSVAAVLTDDLGHTVGDDAIAVVGRVAGAPARGCGLLLEALAP